MARSDALAATDLLPFGPTPSERRAAWRGHRWYQHAPSCWNPHHRWTTVATATIRRFLEREHELGDRAAAQ